MPLCHSFKNLSLKRSSYLSFIILVGLIIFSPCNGADLLPPEMWGEIASHLPYKDQLSLSEVSKNQLEVLRQREAEVERRLKEEPNDTALSLAYQNLPPAWKTPKILLRLMEQVEEMGIFAKYFPKPLIDFLYAREVGEAIYRKIIGLAEGGYGYEKDLDAANALIEEWSSKGLWKVIEMKIFGYAYGYYGYENKPGAAKDLIEEWSLQGVWKVIRWKINGFAYGLYEYKKKPDAAKDLIEEWCAKGVWEAIQFKIQAIENGWYGYEKNPTNANKLIEEQIAKRAWQAVELLVEGYENGMYGYEKNQETANNLTESISSKDNWQIRRCKIEGLAEGNYGYKKDPAAAVKELFKYFRLPVLDTN